MIKRLLFILLVAGAFSCTQKSAQTTDAPAVDSAKAADKTPFPDFGFMVANYHGPVFKLSQNYPEAVPTEPLPDFFKIDFKKDWHKYLEAVRTYCFEGNTGVDFKVEYNKVRGWYHMPWQHYGPKGREGFHGLTQEAPVKAFQLAPTQTIDTAGAIAVGFYNDVSAYTIGQVWKDHYSPDSLHSVAFKNGSVLFKLLFVTLPKSVAVQQAPFLVNGVWWDAFCAPNFKKPNNRFKTQVALIQMDIMVRDDRAPNGWIFGNFQYNGALNKTNKWENLAPLGISWGDDPNITTNASNPKPTVTIINHALVETVINPDTKELPPTHLGWNSRLNGPVDNPMSSCYSCHSTAEYPENSPLSPLFFPTQAERDKYPPGSPAWMRWFANLKCGQPFDKDSKSMDFSLQLSASIQYFNEWKATQAGLYASAYKPALEKPMLKPEVIMTTDTTHKRHTEYRAIIPAN
ncbi:hypothetical protein BEL04_05480 [Mucilaginibacter sp. PPCGB 2223]|uniref:hypothetical protein n=1 Tax=Mucilaginibacter sp. PPCGB 2223 TaxID=1886027 RepID=UPI0008247F2D|nr:hypothetical protein [Mucilaginibacter sp. PPCGB 2223]OCX53741.1 hypothetical protein BEL04_05480 [Mucilaginibacter sp. PPCGB 2223]